jgi:hypothetical protein
MRRETFIKINLKITSISFKNEPKGENDHYPILDQLGIHYQIFIGILQHLLLRLLEILERHTQHSL